MLFGKGCNAWLLQDAILQYLVTLFFLSPHSPAHPVVKYKTIILLLLLLLLLQLSFQSVAVVLTLNRYREFNNH